MLVRFHSRAAPPSKIATTQWKDGSVLSLSTGSRSPFLRCHQAIGAGDVCVAPRNRFDGGKGWRAHGRTITDANNITHPPPFPSSSSSVSHPIHLPNSPYAPHQRPSAQSSETRQFIAVLSKIATGGRNAQIQTSTGVRLQA